MYDSRARLISTNLLEIPCIAEPREFRFRVSSEREKQKQTEIKQRTEMHWQIFIYLDFLFEATGPNCLNALCTILLHRTVTLNAFLDRR